uniref:ATP synthase subunit a n=1 Tax=Stenopsyche angustata TaxID=1560148 RepID=A0A7L8XF40_9NEOP|nr:ATP synthase F0 subunit 6 [Stenopsyche angustata]QOH91243.1 ATP synthase F0 subunit 6 [Stenopsyche angustata]
MMNNLFSIFDPSSILNLSMNWMSSIIGIFIIPLSFWFLPTRMMIITNSVLIYLHKEFKMLLKINKNKGSTLMFISIFLMLMFNNFLGLFPYIFTSTSHLSMNLTLSLPLWITFMLYGWINKTNHMFSHLVPNNTPTALMPFMVLIETISNLIRPMTLAVRLTANMIAGHLLLTLLSGMELSLIKLFMPLLILTQMLLMTLEMAVAIIQAYVFSTLSILYSSEI